jgi:hypothetical protein
MSLLQHSDTVSLVVYFLNTVCKAFKMGSKAGFQYFTAFNQDLRQFSSLSDLSWDVA